jgi:hypothetical protein
MLQLDGGDGQPFAPFLTSAPPAAPTPNMDPMMAVERIVSGLDDTKEKYTPAHEQFANR